MRPSSSSRMQPWPLLVAWAAVALTLVGFVLPWARIEIHEPSVRLGRIAVTLQRGSKTIRGDVPTNAGLPTQVSGWQIPQLANQEQARVATAMLEFLTKTRQHVGLKSYAVYLVPGVALLCGIGLTVCWRFSPLVWVIGSLCAAVAGAGWWSVLTTHPRTLFVAVTIERGVWCSLWGYVGLACAAGWLLIWARRQRT